MDENKFKQKVSKVKGRSLSPFALRGVYKGAQS